MMTPLEFREWQMVYEEMQTPGEDGPNAWQDLLWAHLESQNYCPAPVEPVNYSEAIGWAAFWIAFGSVLVAMIVTGRAF